MAEALKIYIASSGRNALAARILAEVLRADGHLVDCFCDPSTGRETFHWSEVVEKEEDLQEYDAVGFMRDPRVQQAFEVDRVWLDWSDVVVMLHPCGDSAHLEAGYAKGTGKKLFMYGVFPDGKVDVMYGFADEMFRMDQLGKLRRALQGLALEKRRRAARA